MNCRFKEQHSLEERVAECQRIIKRYPDRIPIIVDTGKGMPTLDKQKYLAPSDLTIGQFAYTIRKRLQFDSQKAMFLLIDGAIPPTASSLSSIHQMHRDADGFLYITVASENTFGFK